MKKRPMARSEGLLVEEMGDELIICDIERDVVHNLNGPAAACWRELDGTRNISTLAGTLYPGVAPSVSIKLVQHALQVLDNKHLLEHGVATGSITRREVLGKLHKQGIAAAGLLAVVVSLSSPSAVDAQSPGQPGSMCNDSSDCFTGCCANDCKICCNFRFDPGNPATSPTGTGFNANVCVNGTPNVDPSCVGDPSGVDKCS